MIRRRNKNVYGFGINDSDREVSKTTAYSLWVGMIERCYCEHSRYKYRTYANVDVCEDWKYFSNFEKWFNDNYIEGFELDKDIFSTNLKIYSPETCVFICPTLNKFLNKCSNTQSKYLLGVSPVTNYPNKYRARFWNPLTNKRNEKSGFTKEIYAHLYYLISKYNLLDDMYECGIIHTENIYFRLKKIFKEDIDTSMTKYINNDEDMLAFLDDSVMNIVTTPFSLKEPN